jgi:hypothetical protein
MSEEWRPSERCLALLTEKDHKRGDLEDQIEAFRDYHLKKGNEYADWDAAFRTWMRNSKKFAAERAAKAKSAEVMI